MNPYLLLGGAVGSIAMALVASFFAYGQGKKTERLIWETANVQVLVEANSGLADSIKEKDVEIARLSAIDVDAGNKINTTETRVIERIREVPVEKVVKVYSDCRIDYGLVELRNSWAQGDSFSKPAEGFTASDLSLVGAPKVSGNAGGY